MSGFAQFIENPFKHNRKYMKNKDNTIHKFYKIIVREKKRERTVHLGTFWDSSTDSILFLTMPQKNDRSTFAYFYIKGYELFDKYEPYPNKRYITIDIKKSLLWRYVLFI